jgi:formylmethanofuran dehydrogenase subunit B
LIPPSTRKPSAISTSLTIIEDVACTGCGCLCDDLRFTIDNGRIIKAERACELVHDFFLSIGDVTRPSATIAGQPAAWTDAISKSADILRAAKSPVIFGLSRSCTEGQRAAAALADFLGATIDTTASACHGPSILALQQVGESTCTLGEVKNRSDLVIFWGSNPVKTHPRHFERYSVEPCGYFTPTGRAGRKLVVIDVEPNETTAKADWPLIIKPGYDFQAISALRMLLRDIEPPPGEYGLPLDTLKQLATTMKAARSGVIFFGYGLTRQNQPHRLVEILLRLVTELNDHTRFYARRMRIPGDVAGADSVLCWQTGYPFSVNLAAGYPRYNPGEFSAGEMWANGEADAAVLLGSEGVASLSPDAIAGLSRIPIIAIDYPLPQTGLERSGLSPAVSFTTDIYGIHRPGTAYRMDEVPIPLKAVLPSHYPSDAEVLDAILNQLRG